jgi:hypothetical protein
MCLWGAIKEKAGVAMRRATFKRTASAIAARR